MMSGTKRKIFSCADSGVLTGFFNRVFYVSLSCLIHYFVHVSVASFSVYSNVLIVDEGYLSNLDSLQ